MRNPRDQKTGWLRLAVFASLGMLYVIERGRHPGFHDSLSYLWDAVSGPSLATNATNHFLYNNFQWLLVRLLPFLDPVTILSGVSMAFGMLSLLQLERLANEFTGDRRASLMAVLTFGVSFSWWQQVETIEVYAFNAFLFLGFVLHSVRSLKSDEPKQLHLAALYLMLALLTHIQNILCIPFFLWLVWKTKARPASKLLALAPLAGAVILLLVPPMALKVHSLSAIFFDTQFQKDVMGFDLALIGKGIVKGIAFFGYNFHLWLIPMAAGFMGLLRTDKRMFGWLCLLLLPFLAFAVKYSVSDNHVFYISVYAVMAALSTKAWEKFFSRRPALSIVAMIAALIASPILYLGTTAVVRQLPQGKELEAEKAYKGGVAHYTWPGRRTSPDPIGAATVMQEKGTPIDSVEWNAAPALRYVEWMRSH